MPYDVLFLNNSQFRSDGIFGELVDDNHNLIAHTLQHSYGDDASGWTPKIPDGEYLCVRGMHRLHNMTEDFETFEITGVEGHTNLLFHWGNYDADSEGCVLLGMGIAESAPGIQMITFSKAAFARLMKIQERCDHFTLHVNKNWVYS